MSSSLTADDCTASPLSANGPSVQTLMRGRPGAPPGAWPMVRADGAISGHAALKARNSVHALRRCLGPSFEYVQRSTVLSRTPGTVPTRARPLGKSRLTSTGAASVWPQGEASTSATRASTTVLTSASAASPSAPGGSRPRPLSAMRARSRSAPPRRASSRRSPSAQRSSGPISTTRASLGWSGMSPA